MRKALDKTKEVSRRADAPSVLAECSSVHPGGAHRAHVREVKQTLGSWHADPTLARAVSTDPIRHTQTTAELAVTSKYLSDARQKAMEVEVLFEMRYSVAWFDVVALS
jgi:hypothetical protein